MKSIQEIQAMVESSIMKDLNKDEPIEMVGGYYNAALDASYLLAGLLELLLKERVADWDSNTRWIDDSLIEEVDKRENKFGISGVMIWGRNDTSEQWTDPFYFEMRWLGNDDNRNRLTFLFCDLDSEEMSYGTF